MSVFQETSRPASAHGFLAAIKHAHDGRRSLISLTLHPGDGGLRNTHNQGLDSPLLYYTTEPGGKMDNSEKMVNIFRRPDHRNANHSIEGCFIRTGQQDAP